jgi:hypothetical protein
MVSFTLFNNINNPEIVLEQQNKRSDANKLIELVES